MKAGFYQFNPSFGQKAANLQKVSAAIKEADADLVVLPEFFATGYQFTSQEEVVNLAEPVPQGETTNALIALAQAKGCYIIAGLPESTGAIFYNSAVIVGPEGFIGIYRKTHLFFEEKLYFSPGDTGFKVWDTDIGRIGIMICFDWFFPESMRSLALSGAEVVAHPANLVLPYCPRAMPVRCLENRVYAITANRTGIEKRKIDQSLTYIGQSQIVSPYGEVLVTASAAADSLHIAEIDPAKARNKLINPFNDLFNDRRPDMYRLLA
jgi:predicted amidohydrolase